MPRFPHLREFELAAGCPDSRRCGWVELKTAPAPVDNDHDGMPYKWEWAHGLSPNDPDDWNDVADYGYIMLEKYLNILVTNFERINYLDN